MADAAVREVEGKVALVTGAASGIGRATVELLHARGAKVVAQDVDDGVKELQREGIIATVGDVTNERNAIDTVALARRFFGSLDILVNNAGRIVYKPIIDLSLEEWQWQMDTNSVGRFSIRERRSRRWSRTTADPS